MARVCNKRKPGTNKMVNMLTVKGLTYRRWYNARSGMAMGADGFCLTGQITVNQSCTAASPIKTFCSGDLYTALYGSDEKHREAQISEVCLSNHKIRLIAATTCLLAQCHIEREPRSRQGQRCIVTGAPFALKITQLLRSLPKSRQQGRLYVVRA